jgi:hypothetical protein
MTEPSSPFAVPLTATQLSMLLHERGHPEIGSAYHIAANYRLDGPLRPGLLGAAFEDLVVRHEALRTVFRMIDGEWRQVVLPEARTSLRQVDCGPDDAAAELVLCETAEQPFQLDTGPLIRGVLVRRTTEHHVLSIVMHHLVSDGRSTGVIANELTADYAARTRGERPAGQPGRLQLADFALWLAEAVPRDELLRQGRFWQRRLADVPRDVAMPCDRPRSAVLGNVADHHEFTVPSAVAARLRQLARRSGVTLYLVLLAVTEILVCRLGGQELFALGSNSERRSHAEFENVVGCLMTRLPIRADLRGDPSLSTLLPRVRQAVTDALANQDVALLDDVAEPSPPWAPGVPALSQLTFQLQYGGFATLDTIAAGVRFEPIAGVTGRIAKEMIVLFVDDGELRCGLQWFTDLYDRATALALSEEFLVLLDAVSHDPGQSIWELPLARDGGAAVLDRGAPLRKLKS